MSQQINADEVSEVIERYSDMVRRICFLYVRNHSDVEDIFQDVFFKFYVNKDSFKSEQHKKAWLCRVAFNKCKDLNKSFWRNRMISIDKLEIPSEDTEQHEMMTAVLQLPSEYKEVIYLHYYEKWTIPEIAEITQKNVNTVYTQLRRAKEKLKKKVGEI